MQWLGEKLPAALVTAAGLALGAAVAQSQAAEPIRIGAFLDVSGGAAFLGDPELKTLRLYTDRINAAGGVLGRPLELVAYDTRSQTETVPGFVKRLIYNDLADLIIGGSSTGSTMAAVPLIERAEIPFISLAGADVIVDPIKPWVFKMPHSDGLAVSKIFKDMVTRGITKIGLLSGSGGFDQSCRANAQKLAPGFGVEIVGDEVHGRGDTDMTPQLTRLSAAPGVAGLLYCGFGAATSIVARNVRQLGLTLPHYQTHGSGSQKFIDAAAGAAEGVRLPAAALLVAAQLADDHPQKAVALAYQQTYEAAFEDDISTFGGHAYDGLMVAVRAIEAAGGTDKAKVRAAIEATAGYVGVDGVYTMSATDHQGLDVNSFVMVEVRNGAWAMLDGVQP